ncbi:hypothetical protein [Natronocalculus amylovorans]|uniref:Uncharacterized protein n=1 Tax=Natronocalculus amylovorans TaxID=2917812 RepID=A0AAE3FYZ1_9EURY|nr:hypothetical protein [Natronocalculus amylovorans]MCL9817891.1 hypothetical protein [Natronocalculus amylovorans]
MVGPSITEEERNIANKRLKIGFILLVAFSAVLMALQVDPTLQQLAVIFIGGVVFGAVLLWFVLRNMRTFYRRV